MVVKLYQNRRGPISGSWLHPLCFRHSGRLTQAHKKKVTVREGWNFFDPFSLHYFWPGPRETIEKVPNQEVLCILSYIWLWAANRHYLGLTMYYHTPNHQLNIHFPPTANPFLFPEQIQILFNCFCFSCRKTDWKEFRTCWQTLEKCNLKHLYWKQKVWLPCRSLSGWQIGRWNNL